MILGFLKGLIVGIIVSIPVGPLGLLCIPRTLGRVSGLSVGLGGTSSDALYSALALFALSFISGFIDAHEEWVLLAGGMIICVTGLNLLLSRQRVRSRDVEEVNARAVAPARHAREYLNGFLISVTNPGTLVCMLWLFTFLGFDTSRQPAMLAEWAGTVFGSAGTWFLITWSINRLRNSLTLGQLHWLTRISGGVILLIGLSSVVKSIAAYAASV